MTDNNNGNNNHKIDNRKRQRAHIYWESNCAICSNLFQHDRMSAVYCTQKCRNRSRSFSSKMLESLHRKSLMTLRSFKRTTEEEFAVISNTSNTTETLETLRAIGASSEDIKQMLELARLDIARKKLASEKARLNRVEDTYNPEDHSNIIDPEMTNFQYPNTDNAGFGSTKKDPEMEKLIYHPPDSILPVLDREEREEKKEEPKKTGLRRIGEK